MPEAIIVFSAFHIIDYLPTVLLCLLVFIKPTFFAS